ncbi:MAG: transcription termination factor Rho [Candidatus Shapirobacteria bacterium]|nr:transcription termination factor Rho [Candidatus Shapirobacteria bacterium]
MIKKKTDDVVVSEPVKAEVSEVKVNSVKQEVKEEVKAEEIKKDNNVVSFVKPTVQQPQVQPSKPQIPRYNPPAPVQTETIIGALEVMQDGQGFVRPKFIPTSRDAFIGSMQIRRYRLRAGDMILGQAKAPKENEKYWAMTRIDKVNDLDLAKVQKRPEFKDLVPIYPQKQIKLETSSDIYSTRIIDLFSPIGFGQRGMVVSPPKAGKTTLLKEIAAGVSINYPEAHLMAVLVGERPEEVTDMQRFIKGEVVASSFDQKPEEQTRSAEIAMERAKRLVEMGKDVIIVFDSITRLARAYNLAIPTSGRTLSGGFDPAALYPSKRFFGAARKIENGGSLTIIGTALVDTGSKMDDLIFEEFKGTGNMELRLERNLAERRIFPAFDILRSGTRMENLLLDPAVLAKIISIRRMFDALGEGNDTTEMILGQMAKTKNNKEFLDKIGKK